MLRSTEEVHYRIISLLEKCRCKGNAGKSLVLMQGCCMGALSLGFSSPLPPCTAWTCVASWIFLRIIFYLPLYQLLQTPHRARLLHQSLLSLTGNKGCGWLSYLYSEFVTLKTSFSPLISVSLDEHQYHYDTGPSQPVTPKLLGYPGEKKGWLQLSFS